MDLTVLQIIWWALIGALLIGFALTDGFDMGVGILLPWVARTDLERRIAINAIGPTWEGNQVWFVTAGGATFAAWPRVYATAFSGFYMALLLVLFALFFRPVGFEYRAKVDAPRWRAFWDWGLFAGGLVPSLVFGVAFGNLLRGVPFAYDADWRVSYSGNFFGLLNPFGLLSGLLSIAMLCTHGAALLRMKTDGMVHQRAAVAQRAAALSALLLFVLAGVWIATGFTGYRLAADGTVTLAAGAWLDNFRRWPLAWAAPLCGVLGFALAAALARHRGPFGFFASGLAVIGVILTAGTAMFPFVMPSSADPQHSLTVWNATSSALTLEIMLWAVAIFLPIVVLYTSWVYRVMFGRVTARSIETDHHSY